MMLLWMFSENTTLSRDASRMVHNMLTLTFRDFESRPYAKFFREIVDHGIAPRKIYNAILAAMVEGVETRGGDDRVYGKVIGCATQLRLEDTISLSCHTERAILWYSLAAGRRELCTVKIKPEVSARHKLHHDDQCMMALCVYLWYVLRRICDTLLRIMQVKYLVGKPAVKTSHHTSRSSGYTQS